MAQEEGRVFRTSDAGLKLGSWSKQYGKRIADIEVIQIKDPKKMATWKTHVVEDDPTFDIYGDYGI